VHKPIAFCWYSHCRPKQNLSAWSTYFGEDCAEIFVQIIDAELLRIQELYDSFPPPNLTQEQQQSTANQTSATSAPRLF